MEREYQRGQEKNRVIGIRADGNAEIGMGHLVRCMSLAKAFVSKGFTAVFITAEDCSKELLKKNRFEQIVLDSDFKNLLGECNKLQEIISNRKIELLILDSYFINEEYLSRLKKVVPVVCFEEEPGEYRSIDGIINYNIYAEDLYHEINYDKNINLYLGSSYAPLRLEFLNRRITVKDKLQKILILMGGSDSLNISGQLVKRFLSMEDWKLKNLEFFVVCGPFNPHLQELAELENNQIHILVDVDDMASLMEKCDMAISAAGSTMYELAALGIPTICCYYVDNQRKIAEAFSSLSTVVNTGNYAENPDQVLNNILVNTINMIEDKKIREENSLSMNKLVDGNGAMRLVETLMKDFL